MKIYATTPDGSEFTFEEKDTLTIPNELFLQAKRLGKITLNSCSGLMEEITVELEEKEFAKFMQKIFEYSRRNMEQQY